jgi:hypothetical protein
MDRFLIFLFSGLILLLATAQARADEVTCQEPLPPEHNPALEYKTSRGAGVYEIHWHNPNDTPDVVSCHLKVGAQLLVNYDPVPPLGCFVENVQALTGREMVDVWCVDVDAVTYSSQYLVRFRIPGKPPKLH